MRSLLPYLLAAFAAAGAESAVVFEAQVQLGSDAPDVQGPHYGPRCDIARAIDPGRDGLERSEDVFSGIEAIEAMVKRHQPLVQIPSICYDDLGDFDDDERWKPFAKTAQVLEEEYPYLYKHAAVETVNQFGLVYTVKGWDKDLQPILLTAHQDVVPVEEETLDRWEYPPFEAHYNETDGYLWGHGASDKSAITALMSAMEALLSQDDYDPRRTVVFALGFDGECSGERGAGEIAKLLEERYGKDGIAVILDEGGAGLQNIGDTMYALPAVYEKGYLDVWFDIDVIGGHSTMPPPHTSIGIMAEVVTMLESDSFRPEIARNSPAHLSLTCLAQYSPNALPALTRMIRWGDLRSAAHLMTEISPQTQYFIQTSQAIDFVRGGQSINALPEFVNFGVSYRLAPQDSIGATQHRIRHIAEEVARKYHIRVEAFEDDHDYQEYLVANGLSSTGGGWTPVYKGKLKLETTRRSSVTPMSPTHGPAWNVFSGTVQHSFAGRASDTNAKRIVVAPGPNIGNVEGRYYVNLSQNIYRWSPASLKAFSDAQSPRERLLMSEHVDMAKFYYDLISNYDEATL